MTFQQKNTPIVSGFQQTFFMPQVQPIMPVILPSVPVVSALPAFETCSQALPADTEISLFDCNSNSIIEMPQGMLQYNANGQILPMAGYTFVRMDVPTIQTASVDSGLSEQIDSSVEFKREVENVTVEDVVRSRSPSVTKKAPAPQNKKFRHRSKQERILEVHAELKEKYTKLGLYASDDEVLRGFDTVRVHVKTFHALNQIKFPLQEIEYSSNIRVLKIATPFSMKNRFQKKGFIVYLKLASPDMVSSVQAIFAKYKEHFAKCDVALAKNQSSTTEYPEGAVLPKLDSEKQANKDGMDFSSWADICQPPTMRKMCSLGA